MTRLSITFHPSELAAPKVVPGSTCEVVVGSAIFSGDITVSVSPDQARQISEGWADVAVVLERRKENALLRERTRRHPEVVLPLNRDEDGVEPQGPVS